jgi:hypothetical protein
MDSDWGRFLGGGGVEKGRPTWVEDGIEIRRDGADGDFLALNEVLLVIFSAKETLKMKNFLLSH